MIEKDLFGNIINDKKATKFDLILKAHPSKEETKKKKKILKKINSLKELRMDYKKIEQDLDKINKLFIEFNPSFLKEFKLILKHYLTQLVNYYITSNNHDLILDQLFNRLINHEFELYKNLGFEIDFINKLKGDLNHFKNSKISEQEKQHAIDFGFQELKNSGIEIDKLTFEEVTDPDFINQLYKKHQNNSDHSKEQSFTKVTDNTEKEFKRLYKLLIKVVHPDLTYTNSETNHLLMQNLTHAWETRSYLTLLELHHKIAPTINFELTLELLSVLEYDIDRSLDNLDKKLYFLENSSNNLFYLEHFNSSTDSVKKVKIKNYYLDLENEFECIIQSLNYELESNEQFFKHIKDKNNAIDHKMKTSQMLNDLE